MQHLSRIFTHAEHDICEMLGAFLWHPIFGTFSRLSSQTFSSREPNQLRRLSKRPSKSVKAAHASRNTLSRPFVTNVTSFAPAANKMAAALSPLIRTLRCGLGGTAARLQVRDIPVFFLFFFNHCDRDQFQCCRSLRTDLIYSLWCFIVDFFFFKLVLRLRK